jgi:hypothetical protein
MLRIEDAINYYNKNKKEKDEKLTQQKLGEMILPELDSKTAKFYISRWKGGLSFGKLKPEHIISICGICGIDPNFLYGFKVKKGGKNG